MKDIKDYEGLYGITEDGRVWSYRKNRFLKPQKTKTGYLYVQLSKNNKVKNYKIHRLVATAYLENPLNLPCVNHIDECKTNNCVENLEFCTIAYNNIYGTRIERVAKSLSKKVICIETNEVFESIKEAAKTINYNCHISDCCKGKRKTAGGYHWAYYEEQEN